MIRVQLFALRLALRRRGTTMQTMLDSSALFPMQYQLLSWTRRFRGRTSADDFDTDLRSVLLRESAAAEATTSDAAATPAAAADGDRRLAELERVAASAWCENQHFMVWLRREFLASCFGAEADAAAAAMRARRVESSVDDPLLSLREAEEIFGMPRSSSSNGSVARTSSADDERARAQISAAAGCDAAALPMQELLDVAGCCVGGRGAFNLFCEARQIFEFLTRECVK